MEFTAALEFKISSQHENKKLKRVLTNEIKKSIVIKVVRTTDRKAGISASPWHEQVTRVHISDTD